MIRVLKKYMQPALIVIHLFVIGSHELISERRIDERALVGGGKRACAGGLTRVHKGVHRR